MYAYKKIPRVSTLSKYKIEMAVMSEICFYNWLPSSSDIISLYSSSLISKLVSSSYVLLPVFNNSKIMHLSMKRPIPYKANNVIKTKKKFFKNFLQALGPLLNSLSSARFKLMLLTVKVFITVKMVNTIQNPQPNPIIFGFLSINCKSYSFSVQNSG